jgi:hypothetical protein
MLMMIGEGVGGTSSSCHNREVYNLDRLHEFSYYCPPGCYAFLGVLLSNTVDLFLFDIEAKELSARWTSLLGPTKDKPTASDDSRAFACSSGVLGIGRV